LNRMFTRVRSVETDNAHSFLSMEYVIFSSFFPYFLHIIIIYALISSLGLSFYPALFSVRLIRFSSRQRNCDNGFVLLHKYYTHQIVPRFVCDDCFFFFFIIIIKLLRITNILLFVFKTLLYNDLFG
jgi:hypothetical protein